MKTIEQLLDILETKIDHFEKVNIAISSSSVGWQIAHTTKVLARVTTATAASDPALFKRKFSLAKTIVFAVNNIPRGKGKAPEASKPEGEITKEVLQAGIAKAKEKLQELYKLDSNKYFSHPYFGDVQLKGCIKFLNIHTNHHLKIINDIIK
jgi:hypothetical protein